MKNELMGVAPQNLATDAAGVSLTLTERRFLRTLVKYTKRPDDSNLKEYKAKLVRVGERIGLRKSDVDYIREWVGARGERWLAAERAGIKNELEAARAFRNPEVRKYINILAEKGLCLSTVASKDELADFYTQRMRSQFLPEALRESAAVNLARLQGYNAEAGGAGGGAVNVQINCVNPYGNPVNGEVVENG